MRGLTVSLLLLFAAVSAFPDSPDRIFIRPWVEREPLVRIDDGPYPIPLATAKENILDDAQALLSAMVYGWTFDYIPGDKARRVAESFVLTPVAVIPRGSPRLRVLETELEETRLWARVVYDLDEEEALRRAAWESNIVAMSTGRGSADVIRGPGARMDSLRDAVRDAIRLALDTRWVNKPREITGEVLLWEDPVVIVRSGAWMTSAKVKLVVQELVPYRIF